MLDAFKTCGSSPPKNYRVRTVSFRLVRGELEGGPLMKQTGRLQKFECVFVHRAGFTRRFSVYAIDDATAERIAWCALVGTSGWRPTWAVQSVAAEAR